MSAQHDTFLCKAWGETDLPVAAIVVGLDAVRQFLIDQWLCDADHEHDDGTKALPEAMQSMQDEWEVEGESWPWKVEFEIGGISVQRVFDVTPATIATPPPPDAAHGPMTEAPEVGSEYWVIYLKEVSLQQWDGSEIDHRWLAEGICFRTEADARAALQAEKGSAA